MKKVAFVFLIAILSFVSAAGATEKIAPDFMLKDVAGKNSSLSELRQGKKAVLVNFWATWCPACRKEIPELARLTEKLSPDFSVIGVDVAESDRRVAAYVEKHSVRYPVLLDSDSNAAKSYGVVGLPVSFLIDADGRVIGEYHEYSEQLAKDAERAVR